MIALALRKSSQKFYIFTFVGLTCFLPVGCIPETEESLLNIQNKSVDAELYRFTMSELDNQINNNQIARQMSLMDNEMMRLVCFVENEAISAIESNGMTVGPQMNARLVAFTLNIRC